MARLLVFVDPEAVRDVADRAQERPRANTDHVGGSQAHAATWLLEALKPYAPHLDLVISRQGRGPQSLSDPGARLPPALRERVVDAFGDCPAPRELSRPEQIHYWLARTHVLRTPSWVALERTRNGWPETTWPYIVECDAADSAAVSERLRRVLERFDWAELWWGGGEAPPMARRRLARSLMCLWSVPRREWADLLGRTASEFEARLEVLLTIHAGATLWAGRGQLAPHWVHLPKQALGMRRPLEVMLDEGQAGMARVLELVWAQPPPSG